MTTTAEVRLWGSRIGTVAVTDDSPIARFEYDPSFLLSGIQLSPITMPLSGQVYSFPNLNTQSFHGLPGMLSDSLPDAFGNAVIDSWLESQGRHAGSLNPVERLCYTGSRGMGALEYEPASGPDPSESELLHMDELVDLASRIVSKRKELSTTVGDHAIQRIINVGTSAGGARAKAVIALNEETDEIRSGQLDVPDGFEHWLMKFDGVADNGDMEGADPPCYTIIEYAYHLMAIDAGIKMSECRLLEEDGRHHFLTRRFDRVGSGSDTKKLHMQTLAGLAHFDYKQAGAYSYQQAAEVAQRLGIGQNEIDELFRRMVFNVIARNQDDHVKNISFLMDKKGTWSLSPAYDVTFAFNPSGERTSRHQMMVHGKRDDITFDDLLETAKQMNLKASRAKEIVAQVRSAVGAWRKYAEEAGLDEERSEAIAKEFVWVA